MSKLIDFYKKYLAKLNKYAIVIIQFFVLTYIVGDANLYHRFQYDEKIRSLEYEIKQYRKQIEEDKRKLEELQTNKDGLEQFAREEYLMKKPDEDIFIIED